MPKIKTHKGSAKVFRTNKNKVLVKKGEFFENIELKMHTVFSRPYYHTPYYYHF